MVRVQGTDSLLSIKPTSVKSGTSLALLDLLRNRSQALSKAVEMCIEGGKRNFRGV